jgi:hypothetical protein
MSIEKATDLVTKVGGTLSVVGMLVGAWLTADTTCSGGFTGPKSCRNVFGAVAVDPITGGPATWRLMIAGGFGGAVVGALAGLAIAKLWPSTKEDLFP